MGPADMIALDTNVLVRFLVLDDEKQGGRAVELIEEAARAEESVHLTDVVLCETVWVLAAAYGASRREIVSMLRRLMASGVFAVCNRPTVDRAIDHHADRRGHFADTLIGAAGARAGATTTYTFERSLRDEPEFTFIG